MKSDNAPLVSEQTLSPGAVRKVEIYRALKAGIMDGTSGPGARLPCVADLIGSFSTSPHTVQGAIAQLRREGFVQSRKGVGNFVSQHPPHLCHIVVLFPEDASTSSLWRNNIFRAWRHEVNVFNAEAERRADGYRLSVYQECGGRNVERNNRELLHLIEASRLAGIICIHTPVRIDKILPQFKSLPIVTVMGRRSYAMSIELVDMLPRALDILVGKGRKRVALLSGNGAHDHVCHTFAEQVAVRGMVTRDTWMQYANPNVPDWSANVLRLLFGAPSADRPDGLIIDNDNLIPAATRGIRASNVRIPEDLAIVADCNFPSTLDAHVPIHRLGYDIREGLRIAVELIIRKRAGRKTPTQTYLPLVERDV